MASQRQRIGYLGPEGTFTQQALRSQADLAGAEHIPFRTVVDVLDAVEDGSISLGFVPIENSIEGTVNYTQDALVFDHDLLIQREVVLDIEMCLLAKKGATLQQVTKIYSMPVATAQCHGYIRKHAPQAEVFVANSTAEAARDMDILRAALGDKKLNFFGKSYGTYLGTLYAQFFPDKVGRMVLDGALDPNISILEQNISQAKGFDDALTAFIADCAKEDDCPLPKDNAAAIDEMKNILSQLADKPSERLSESLALLGIASALYDSATGWPKLRAAIKAVKQGKAGKFLELADNYTGRTEDGYTTNEFDSGAIIDCLDFAENRSVEEMKVDAQAFAKQAPLFGPYLAYTNISCKYLTLPTKDKLTRSTNKITSIKTAPVIVIGTTRDPATPYEWSVGLHQIFKNSKLISLDADGHTGQGRGSACVDDAVDSYLLMGKTPNKNLICSL